MTWLVFPLFLALTWAGTALVLRSPVPIELVSVPVTLAIAALAVVLERVWPEREAYVPLDRPASHELGHLALNYNLGYVLGLWACLPFAGLWDVWPSRWHMLAQVVLAAFISEGVSYWQHRLSHQIGWMWRFHSLHHSGERLNAARTGRFHFLDVGPAAFFVFVPLYLLGASPVVIAWFAAFSGTLGVIQHANIRMRSPAWLGRLITTPAVHRMHHSLDRRESDANYGSLVTLYDQVFNTYVTPKPAGPERMGIANDPVPRQFWRSIFWTRA